jgi:3-hydroxy-D-aspartate aldolase
MDWQTLLLRNAADLRTPALIVDLDALERNIDKMAAHCRASGIALRPHAKTHKCVEIARRQITAGAIGQCCTSLEEAEALVAGEIASVLVTAPLVAEPAIRRMLELNTACPGLMAVADNEETIHRLARAAFGAGQTLKLLVDIDIGHHRTGTLPGKPAAALASLIARSPNLEFAGIQGYAGHLMHVADRAERQAGLAAGLEQLRLTRDLLRGMGLAPGIVTGGGTGSFDIDPAQQVLTELQAGSYVFMDRQYNEVWTGPDDPPPFEISLFVLSRVVSANHPGMATTDAGLKAFATDAGAPVVSFGPDATYSLFGDEYGRIALAENAVARLGDAVACMTPHCDPTVNLYGHYLVVRGGELVDRWPIVSGKYRT